MQFSQYKAPFIIIVLVFLSGCESIQMLLSCCQNDRAANEQQDTPPVDISLNDIRALEEIKRQELILEGVPRPILEIHLKDKMLMGNDGCNGYFSSIEELDYHDIVLGTVGSTQKMCADMSIPDRFHKSLHQIVSYKLQDLQLRFFDTDGEELLLFRKID